MALRDGQWTDVEGEPLPDRALDVQFAETVLRLNTIRREDGTGWQEYDRHDGISRDLGWYSRELGACLSALGGTRWRYGDIRHIRLDQQWLLSHYTSTATIVFGGYHQDHACIATVKGPRICSSDLAEALCRVAIEARASENKDVPREVCNMAAGQEAVRHTT